MDANERLIDSIPDDSTSGRSLEQEPGSEEEKEKNGIIPPRL